jgi:ABC-type uncharacterized transport system involved in gliding motility auxiliary subunit
MNGDERTPQSFSWMRRWSAGLNLVITVAAVMALVAMANYLAIRHYKRFHWNRDAEAELSKRTLQVLASLTNTVKVIVYMDSDPDNNPLFPRVKGLLKEYQYASPRIEVRLVDYLRDAAAAKAVKQQYQLNTLNDKDLIIFESKGGKKVVSAGELSDYDYSDLIAGKSNEVYRTHFKGELHFTSAIFSVASDRKPVAYFLIGHNEHSPGGADSEGYGKFTAMLMNENNFEVRPLLLGGTNDIPPNCNLLIIAGPTQPLDRTVLDNIQRYLEQGGRLLIAFASGTARGRPTGLEQLLRKWGVEVGDNTVLDPPHSTGSGYDVFPVELGKHPIVNALQNSQVQLYMPRSVRALRPAARADEVKVDELLFTGPATVVFTTGRTPDPTQRGPKSLMAVVEKSVPGGIQRGSTRIVVIGDSTLWNNQLLYSAGNNNLAAFAANWLVSQNVLLTEIPPRAIRNYRLTMTHTQLRSVQLILMAALPGVVLLIGLLVGWRRRH